MNIFNHTGIFRILAVLVLLGLQVHEGIAASVNFEVLPDRERLTITLSKEEGFAGEVRRVQPRGLLFDLGVPTDGMGQVLAPRDATLFRFTEPRGRAVGIFMQTAAFSYVVTRPDNNTVIVNAYRDPEGERWQPQGRAAQAPVTATPVTGQPAAQSAAEPGTQPGIQPVPPAAPETPAQQAAVTPPAPSGQTNPAGQEAAPAAVRGTLEGSPMAGAAVLPPQKSTVAQTPVIGRARNLAPAGDPSQFRARINLEGQSDSVTMHPEEGRVSGRIDTQGAAGNGSGGQITPADSTGSTSSTPGTNGNSVGNKGGSSGTALPEVVYVDEKGNPVPAPPDPVEAIAEVRRDISMGRYKEALDKVTPLLTHPKMDAAQKEEVKHLYGEMLFMTNQDALAENFDTIVSANVAAMNYNLESPRNAGVYLRLGYLNLKVGNTVEADAYFTRLRRQYPLDENIPLTYYYWGQHYYDKGEMQKAADEFQHIISNYSENRYARDASLGLARSYAALGYYQEAYDIIEYMERRWARLYLESPPILELMGDIAYRQGDLDFALDKYMVYYNLMPNGPNADVILTRIGDVYARKRQLKAATAAYEESQRLFPEKDGGLVAMMRLAEVGIHDAPQVQEMVSMFQEQGGSRSYNAAAIYSKIIKEHPSSDLVPLAMLKLAMWNFAQGRYADSLRQCTELVNAYPTHELAARAKEVALRAFSAAAAEGVMLDRDQQVIANWDQNPIVKEQEENLPTESRVALALSMYKQNNHDGALKIVTPVFRGRKDPTWSEQEAQPWSEQALQLALAINLDYDRWEAIEKLAEQVSLWELTPKAGNQLDYALALAKENLGKSAEAAPLWKKLSETGTLNDKEQAYAEFFLAKDAENRRQLQDAYILGRSSLNRFMILAQQNPGQADNGKISSLLSSLIDICETSGRLAEALEYARTYMESLPENDTQRQGLLFRIANIYRKQNNTPEWRKTLTELIEKYPNSVHGRAAASTLRGSRLRNDAAQFTPSGSL